MSTPSHSKRALLLAHDVDTGRLPRHPGYLGPLLTSAGYETIVVSPMLMEQLPDLAGFHLIVVLGSSASTYDRAPWIQHEMGLLRAADATGIPIYGICFGAQLLAQTFGGSVRKGTAPELGVFTIESDVPGLIPEGPWWHSHYDVITPPPGAVVLARTLLAVQAFAWKNHVGVQFHPEASADTVHAWHEMAHAAGDTSLETARAANDEATLIASDGAAFENRCYLLLNNVLTGAVTARLALATGEVSV